MDAQQAALALGPKPSPFDAEPPNPSLVTTISRVWHVAMGHPRWQFKMHGKFIAELQECDEAHAERIAAMKKAWPALADLNNGQTLDIYPRAKVQWIDDEYQPKNRILVSFEVVPMSKIDESNLYLQKSTKLYKDAELSAQQCIDINHQTGTITPAAAQYEARVKAVEEIMAKRNEPTPAAAADETVADAETAQWEALGKPEAEAVSGDALHAALNQQAAIETGEVSPAWEAKQIARLWGLIKGAYINAGMTNKEEQSDYTHKILSVESVKLLPMTLTPDAAAKKIIDALLVKKAEIEAAAKNGGQTTNSEPTQVTPHRENESYVEPPQNGQEDKTFDQVSDLSPKGKIIPMLPTTLTGISIMDISKRLNMRLAPEAYSAIGSGIMTGKTDLDADRVRDRFEEVFGPMGIGWKITPNSTAGRVDYRSEKRPSADGKREILWHVVTLIAHTLSYAVIDAQGHITWVEASTTSDSHDNTDETYAYRGALTSLMKQFYKLLGGMNHILYGEYDHNKARRDMGRKAS